MISVIDIIFLFFDIGFIFFRFFVVSFGVFGLFFIFGGYIMYNSVGIISSDISFGIDVVIV